ncbi:MAG: amino acid transporter [Proteobacteria bacterium]|nr:amino acid transporter [Pseudomonadota bacterium]
MHELITPVIEGFFVGAGLIMAIGAQNAFLLKQGLKKEHLFLCAITCSISDAFLIVLGVTGIAELFDELPKIADYMRWGGALFLFCYGLRSFYQVFHPHVMVADLESKTKGSKLATFIALLGFTFLNPHTYIDTFLLLGTVGGERPDPEHIPFMIGAVSASFCWFFSLTYGASKLSPLFRNPRAWQILDTLMGFMMIGIAISLLIPND